MSGDHHGQYKTRARLSSAAVAQQPPAARTWLPVCGERGGGGRVAEAPGIPGRRKMRGGS